MDKWLGKTAGESSKALGEITEEMFRIGFDAESDVDEIILPTGQGSLQIQYPSIDSNL